MIQNQWSKWIYLGVVMFAGAVCGSMLLQALPAMQQDELHQGMNNYVEWMKQTSVLNEAGLFWEVFFKHLKWAIAVSLLGISMIGVPIVVLLNFLKGFLLGSSIYMLVQSFGKEGIWLTLYTLLPQNIIAIPAMIILSAASLSFASFLFNNRIRKFEGVLSQQLIHFSTIATGMILLLAGASLVEVYVSPMLLQWYYSS